MKYRPRTNHKTEIEVGMTCLLHNIILQQDTYFIITTYFSISCVLAINMAYWLIWSFFCKGCKDNEALTFLYLVWLSGHRTVSLNSFTWTEASNWNRNSIKKNELQNSPHYSYIMKFKTKLEKTLWITILLWCSEMYEGKLFRAQL